MSGKIKRVWVATVQVTDFPKSIHFYRDLLGLKVQMDGRRFGWMELGPEEPLCKIGLSLVKPGMELSVEPRNTGIVLETDDAENLYKDLSAKGVRFTIIPTKQPWGGIIANFLDPDGNELQAVEHPNHYAAQAPLEGETSLAEPAQATS